MRNRDLRALCSDNVLDSATGFNSIPNTKHFISTIFKICTGMIKTQIDTSCLCREVDEFPIIQFHIKTE